MIHNALLIKLNSIIRTRSSKHVKGGGGLCIKIRVGEPEPGVFGSLVGAAKNKPLLYRLLEDKKHKEIVKLYICYSSLGKIVFMVKIQLLDLFYVSCSFTLVVCEEKNISPHSSKS